tara:strand:- start:397 stop:846 length:450 start_codon:yes stop_codon:yes gene_type:complete
MISAALPSVVINMYRRNATAAFPSPPDAAIQPLDSSARNSLICMALTYGLCGLRASFGERGRSEEWPGESGIWLGTANSGGWRSPQASAETPNNTQEPARSGKKKPQPRTVGVSLLVGRGNLNRCFKILILNIIYQFKFSLVCFLVSLL